MKNRAAVTRRTAIRQPDSNHAYQRTPNERLTNDHGMPTRSVWNALSADEIFPSDFVNQGAHTQLRRSAENET